MLELKEVIETAFKLEDYPEIIASYERELQELEMTLAPFEMQLWRQDAEIESQISAQKAELTNDSLRKAYRREAQQTSDYQQLLEFINKRRDEIGTVKINLKLVENKFTVAKIKERQQTADIELQAVRLQMR